MPLIAAKAIVVDRLDQDGVANLLGKVAAHAPNGWRKSGAPGPSARRRNSNMNY
jgi:hypothetical protein